MKKILAAPVTDTELNTAIYNVENLNGSASVPVGQTQCTGILGSVILDMVHAAIYDVGNSRAGSLRMPCRSP